METFLKQRKGPWGCDGYNAVELELQQQQQRCEDQSQWLEDDSNHLPKQSPIHTGQQSPLSESSSGSTTPCAPKECFDHYSITEIHDDDAFDIQPKWRRVIHQLNPFMVFANTTLYLTYLGLRIACIFWAQQAQNAIFYAAWGFVVFEIIVALPTLLNNGWTMCSATKRARPKLRLVGPRCPTIDVFITCCGEDDELIMDTVRAALDVDYPEDRFRVIILDDGKSAGVRTVATELSYTHPNLHYFSRPKFPRVPHHFKAGNLNYGLEQMHLMPGGAGEFMAALDADMIPERDWLRAIIPHLLIDPNMALACPPQLFYNTPASDPLCQSMDFFCHTIEPIKDMLGVAWCTGSGYIVRRKALDDIENFPRWSVAEDVATSTLMLGKGWKTAYVHEPLQFGTVPEDFSSHLKQRTRWAVGTVDYSFKFNFFLWGNPIKEMHFAQRYSGFLYALISIHSIFFCATLLAIPITFIQGNPLVAYATKEQLRLLIQVCVASTICTRLSEAVISIPSGYHTSQRQNRYGIWMAPFIAVCLIRAFILPKWLGGQSQTFKATGSLSSVLNERDPKLRKSMSRRLLTILFGSMGWFHFSYVAITLTGVAYTTYRCAVNSSTLDDMLLDLLTHAFWPPLQVFFICSSFWVPIGYALFPPSMPDREELLIRDPKTKIAHPTAASKHIAFGGQAAWFELDNLFRTIYSLVAFFLSFKI